MSLVFDAGLDEVQRKVDSVCTLAPDAKSFPRSDKDLSFNMSLHRDVMQGTGFYDTLVNGTNNVEDLADKLGLMTLDGSSAPEPAKSRSLPVVSYLSISDSSLSDAVVAEALEDDQDRLRAYLSSRPLGIGLIAGPVSTGTHRCSRVIGVELTPCSREAWARQRHSAQ